MSNKWRAVHFFFILARLTLPVRVDRRQCCENRKIFLYAIDAIMANTDIDINSHNYHKIYIRNLRLVHGWHYMVRDLALVFVFGVWFHILTV